jgi:hypothetical protein
MSSTNTIIAIIAFVIFVVTLALPIILPILGYPITDTVFTYTTWVEAVIVFFGAFAGVKIGKVIRNKAQR